MPNPGPDDAPAQPARDDAFLDDLDLSVPDRGGAPSRRSTSKPGRRASPGAPGRGDADPPDVWDRLIEWLLIGLIAYGPLALGAVEAWSEAVVLVAATALSLFLLAKVAAGRQRFVWSWAYVPIVLFLVIVAGQLLPLPADLVARLSPETVRLKGELLADLPDASEHLRSVALTFYAAATRHDLRLTLATAAIFVVVVNTFRRPAQVKRLLAAVAVIGGAAALLALAQHATRSQRIFWTVETDTGPAIAGPFVNHSHFSQFMNLSMGAAFGLLLVKVREMSRGNKADLPLRRLAQWQWDRDARAVWLLGAVIVIALLAVALSMSRGGILSTVLAAAVTGVVILLTRRRGGDGHLGTGQGSLLALFALIAFACLLFVGFDAVYERFTPKGGIKAIEGGRWQMLVDVSKLCRKFPVLGTGLGTHQYVFPMVDTTESEIMATHVENEYAQLMVETGAAGVAAALAFLATIATAWARGVRRGRTLQAASIGLGFGMVAILSHSLSDFGQHVPANAVLTAVTCGLIIAIFRIGRTEADEVGAAAGDGERAASGAGGLEDPARGVTAPGPVPAPARLAGVVATATLVAALASTLPEADRRRRAENHWDDAAWHAGLLSRDDWQGDDERYVALLRAAGSAADLCPDDVEYRFGLNEYRWHSISRERDPETGQLAMTEAALGHAARIVDELHTARPLCPTYGAPYTLAGQIEAFVLGREAEGAAHIRTGYSLDRQDSAASFVVAQLEASEGNWDASLAAMRRATRLAPNVTAEALDLYLAVDRPDLAVELAGEDPHLLLRLADGLEREKKSPELVEASRAKAFEQLKAAAERPDPAAADLAAVAGMSQERGDHVAAIGYWRRALAVQFSQTDWRLALARSLLAAGRTPEAERELKVCLSQRPQWPPAVAMMEEMEALKEKSGEAGRGNETSPTQQ